MWERKRKSGRAGRCRLGILLLGAAAAALLAGRPSHGFLALSTTSTAATPSILHRRHRRPPATAPAGTASRLGNAAAGSGGSEAGEDDGQQIKELASQISDSLGGGEPLDAEILELLDREVEKGKTTLKEEALGAFGDQSARNEELSIAFGEALQRESDALVQEMEEKAEKMMDKMQASRAQLEKEMMEFEELQRTISRDPLIQLRLFARKSLVEKSALVAAILVANQAVYQFLLIFQGRNGDPAVGAAEAILVLVGLYVYGFRI